MAKRQRGGKNKTNQKRGDPRHINNRNRHAGANTANTASQSNRYANIICFRCGKEGHTAPYCPEKKKEGLKTTRPAQGNTARDTQDKNNNSPEVVCLARPINFELLEESKISILPNTSPPPVITVDTHAREICNTKIFVSLAVRVDESTFGWEQEQQLKLGNLPTMYTGDLEPLDEPLWVLLHNRPWNNLDTCIARITYPDHQPR